MGFVWWVTCLVVLAIVALAFAWKPFWTALNRAEYERVRKQFHQQRERLECKFLKLASESGKPRGLRWVDCDFDDDVTYARDKRSGELCAFVAVTISFEAIKGGLMEDVEAVGNLRAASAVFRSQRGAWQTDGRALFNLNPSEAVAFYQDNLELVAHEAMHKV